MERLSPAEVLRRMRDEGAALVDLREPAAFCAGHPPGALSVRFDDRHLAERAGRVARPGGTWIVLAPDDEVAAAAVTQLAAAGRVLGEAERDPAAWAAAGAPWVTLEAVESGVLATDAGRARYHVLDVREPLEWEVGHVPGANLISLGALRERVAEVPRDREIAVICEAGVRSASAASLLQAAGYDRIVNVSDGTAGYRRANHPLEHTAAPNDEDDEEEEGTP